ncbi:MAG TPA: HRDC domain-containing protein [Kofleriaceae bacterium]|nr:HRDC domain-containing protein [Kofleriaceae bacterium]
MAPDEPTRQLTTEPAEVAEVVDAIRRAPLVAFDLEFVSQDRLVPALCLIQVAWLGEHVRLDAPALAIVAEVPHVRLVDPLSTDSRPIVEALAAHDLVIAHAPRQDLALLATRFGTSMPGVVDTQLMAAFCGIGDQIGLASLGNDLLGLSLAKDMQWTDWEKRPLSAAQLTYADADVRHLPALYAKLADRLGPRLEWVREESRAILDEAIAAANVTPETAWQNVGGMRGLDETARAAVVVLAAWRQRVAAELDRPLGQVLPDKALVELAKVRPGNPGGVRSVKGMSPIGKTRADEIALAIKTATATAAVPAERRMWRAPSARAQRWSELLLAIVQIVSEETGIAPRLLATRADAEEFARAVDEHGLEAAAALPALATWRRDVLGSVWEGWLAGRISVIGEVAAPHGMRLLPRS